MAHREYNRESVRAAALSGVGMLFSTGPIVLATFSLFMLPMARQFGWGRGQISLALVFSSGCAALSDPIVGRLVDRLGVRRVVIPGIVFFGLANLALAFVGASLGMLYGLFMLVGISSVTCAAVPYSKVISAWFSEKRGMVLGLALGIGAGIGSAFISQLTRFLIDHLGWREARLTLAALILLVPLPLMAALLREPDARSPGRDTRMALTGYSGVEARRQPTFYLLFAMILVGTTALAGAVVHMVAMLTDKGTSVALATSIYSIYVAASILGRIIAGWMQDKVSSPKVGLPVYLSALLGLLLLAHGTALPTLITGAVLVGLGFGAEIALAGYWVSRFWGLRCYGEIYGFIYAAASAGAAAGPFVMGWAFQRSGSYGWALAAFQFAIVACMAGNLCLGPYVFAARRAPSNLDESDVVPAR